MTSPAEEEVGVRPADGPLILLPQSSSPGPLPAGPPLGFGLASLQSHEPITIINFPSLMGIFSSVSLEKTD